MTGTFLNVRVQGSTASLTLGDKVVTLNLAPGSKIQNIYQKLAEFGEVRIESLDGITISQSTDLSELQGSSFLIRLNNLTYKIISSDFSTSIGMHKFLFESEEAGLSKYMFMHKYLSKLSKSLTPKTKYAKEHLAVLIDETCPRRQISNAMSGSELQSELVRVFEDIERMHPMYEVIHKRSENYARNVLWGGFLVTVLQFSYITAGSYYFACWDVMEAQAYLIGLGNSLFGLSAYVSYQLNPDHESFYTRLYNRSLKSQSKKQGFDLDQYETLQSKLKNLQALITLEKPTPNSNS